MIFNNTLSFFRWGSFYSYDLTIKYDPDTKADFISLISPTRLIVGLDDSLSLRMIPECVDLDTKEFIFLDWYMNDKFAKPNIDTIEQCYFDELGIPDELKTYYTQVGAIRYGDTHIVHSAMSNILMETYPAIISIVFEPLLHNN